MNLHDLVFAVGQVVLIYSLVPTVRAVEKPARQTSLLGVEYGYAGSGPAELARCILIDYLDLHENPDLFADGNHALPYQSFKFDVIARLPQDEVLHEITGDDIQRWLDERAERAAAEVEPS